MLELDDQMTKLQVRRYDKPTKAPSDAKVGLKTVRGPDGQILRVRSVSANSASFGSDFLYVFKQNVKRARKENRERVAARDPIDRDD